MRINTLATPAPCLYFHSVNLLLTGTFLSAIFPSQLIWLYNIRHFRKL